MEGLLIYSVISQVDMPFEDGYLREQLMDSILDNYYNAYEPKVLVFTEYQGHTNLIHIAHKSCIDTEDIVNHVEDAVYRTLGGMNSDVFDEKVFGCSTLTITLYVLEQIIDIVIYFKYGADDEDDEI